MNKALKHILQFISILAITVVVAISSPLNPWIMNSFTDIQNSILDIAHSVREGYLAYVELDGHYGPVVYEFFGLGYLPTDSHILQFAMETVLNFVSILFLYKTAKLYTSPIFAWIATALLSIFAWGSLTHAGAEELMFFVLSLSCYHIARQLKSGFLSHHTYLLAIDLGIVFFLQPGYIFFWVALIIFFAIKFKVDGIDKKSYRSFWGSTLEGLVTVIVPMGIYLYYFKNAYAFLQNVVVYNMQRIGSFAEGFKIVCGTPWTLAIAALIIAIIVKLLKKESIGDLCVWLGITLVAMIVIAIQGENLPSYATLVRALYIVPLASLLSLLDGPLGLKVEEREV